MAMLEGQHPLEGGLIVVAVRAFNLYAVDCIVALY